MAQTNERQRRFAEAYLRCGDPRQAALAAGYRPDYGRRALRTAGVRRRIDGANEPRAEPETSVKPGHAAPPGNTPPPAEPGYAAPLPDGRVASEREVLEFLTDVMRGEMETEGRSASASPRMKAAELLGKRLGAFNEAAEAASPPVILDDIPPEEGAGDG